MELTATLSPLHDAPETPAPLVSEAPEQHPDSRSDLPDPLDDVSLTAANANAHDPTKVHARDAPHGRQHSPTDTSTGHVGVEASRPKSLTVSSLLDNTPRTAAITIHGQESSSQNEGSNPVAWFAGVVAVGVTAASLL